VIDLSEAGRQPMSSEDGKVQIVYNGEVYNFKELRKLLEGHGHRFETGTDTEVILKAYLEWGIACLKRFVGMFSLAIWDGRNRRLFLARDRLGIKPLYYYQSGGILLFASELKAIMGFRIFPREIDPDALSLFLHYQYIPAPRSIFRATHKLLPGSYMAFDEDGEHSSPYWHLPEPPEKSSFDLGEEESLEHLDHLMTRATSDRLISDVPLGALLSGGIDSSVVAALMQKANSSPIRTFSVGFTEKTFDEAPWALKVASHLGTDHTELYVTPAEAMEAIPRLPEVYDEPFADASAIPTFLVCRLARSRVTVALSGDGGDEQFSGYVRYWSTREMWDRFQQLPRPVKRLVSKGTGLIPQRWVTRSYPLWSRLGPRRFQVANFPDKWQKFVAMLEPASLSDLYRTSICIWPAKEIPLLTGRHLPESIFEEAFRESEGWPLISRLMRVDQRTYLPDGMLTKVDRASMAVSLEVRIPLLDHRVVEFASLLPEELKHRNGTGKYLLKRLLARYVPGSLVERPKMGFGVPMDRWLRRELKDMLLDFLSPQRLKKEGLFNPVLVEKKIGEHLSGRINHQYRLWALLVWEMWRRRWMESAPN